MSPNRLANRIGDPASRSIVPLAGVLAGTALILGACTAGTTSAHAPAKPSQPAAQHSNKSFARTAAATSPASHAKRKSASGGSHKAQNVGTPAGGLSFMVSNLGPPRVVSSCAGKGDDPVYEITGPAHFRVVGGGTCSTTLTWSLPSGVQSWTGEASLDPHDATGSRIVMEADRKPVSFLADRRPSSILNLYGPETIVVPLAGAHTFSIVVPATQGDRFAGPETVVIAAGSIHDTPIGTLHAPAPSEPETLVYSRACPGAFPATVEPSEIPIACADYNMRISNIDWSSWSPTGATGTGMLDVNDCDPSCAAGTFHSTPTALTLSAPQRTATQGLVFSTLTYVTQDGTLATWSLAPTASCSSYYENC